MTAVLAISSAQAKLLNSTSMELKVIHNKYSTMPQLSKCSVWKKNTFTCKATSISMKNKAADYYEILSLESKNVKSSEIKKAYRSLALQYHPDVCSLSSKEESTKLFVELQKAYETLSNPVTKKKYDHELALISLGVDRSREKVKGMDVSSSKEIWMNQINELMLRSEQRMARKKRF